MKTLHPQSLLAALLDAPVLPGRVVWIGLRPARRAPMVATASVVAEAGKGLAGDRYQTSRDGPRQVTLIQQEHLAAIASYLGRGSVTPAMLRRNIVISGINLLALRHRHFRIGNALLEATGECHPCSRMEEILGTGGYNAVRGHGGIMARVLESGLIALDDHVAIAL